MQRKKGQRGEQRGKESVKVMAVVGGCRHQRGGEVIVSRGGSRGEMKMGRRRDGGKVGMPLR